MELLIVRHGPAVDRAKWANAGRRDAERPLTADGRRRAKASAEGLRAAFGRADLVASSPWKRAAQTAALVAEALDAPRASCPALLPSRPFEDLAAWLGARREKKIALVGHEPHLSGFASWLMTGGSRSVVRLKKSQALLLELDSPARGSATLAWSLSPRQLRALAGE